MKPLLVFDLDGTLIDSARDIANALNKTLVRHGKNPVDYDTIVAHIGDGLRKLLGDFFPEYKDKHAEQEVLVREFLDDYEEQMTTHTKLFDGVQEFFKRWTGPIGIITNKNEIPARALVKHLGLDHLPWVQIYGADSLAERKPSPLPLQEMMRLAGRTPAQTVMIGDGTPDILSAKRAGVHAVAINFGYTDVKVLKELGAVAELSHYDELEKLIDGLSFSF